MSADSFEHLKAEFIKKFAAVPVPLRSEIIVVVDSEPLSWSATYLEAEQGTERAKKALKILKEIKVV